MGTSRLPLALAIALVLTSPLAILALPTLSARGFEVAAASGIGGGGWAARRRRGMHPPPSPSRSATTCGQAKAEARGDATMSRKPRHRAGELRRRPTTRAARGNGGGEAMNDDGGAPPRRRGVWMPPSLNAAQRRGVVFSIKRPQDLLDFVIEDERLGVVKVYASWCKTCQVFDVRYRKLASRLGDGYDAETGTEVVRRGRARFAEMQFDDPNNEEMCKLLNATQLPYIFVYKGSRGKVAEFQCGPSKFQTLIDAVNEHADPDVDEHREEEEFLEPVEIIGSGSSRVDGDENATITSEGPMPYNGELTADSLRRELATLEKERYEMFEVMKAQIEHDKSYIQKLEAGVETQRSMIEDKDKSIEQQRSAMAESEMQMQRLEESLRNQEEQTKRANEELSMYKSQVEQLTTRISKVENRIGSLVVKSSLSEKTAREKEGEMTRQRMEWEGEKKMYERERNSLRQLSLLGVKRVGRILKSLGNRIRR